MTPAPSNLRGIAAMLVSTASFVTGDSFLKLLTEALPPFQVLFMRGVFATLFTGALVLALGQGAGFRHVVDRMVLTRSVFETVGTLCFVVSLAALPIAEVTAIFQTAPLLFVVLVAVIWREPIGAVRFVLVGFGFVGALLVARPGPDGLSPAALLAFATALCIALRDVVGRRVPPQIPALVVTVATMLVVTVSSGAATLLVEDPVWPAGRHLLYLLAASLFVAGGQFTTFLAFRLGEPGVVAPFFYGFAVWAVIAGVLIFGEWPDPLALAGIAIIVASGLAVVLLDRRQVRDPLEAVPD
jgi:drug/metabolite transporter (DMT)-like permease